MHDRTCLQAPAGTVPAVIDPELLEVRARVLSIYRVKFFVLLARPMRAGAGTVADLTVSPHRSRTLESGAATP